MPLILVPFTPSDQAEARALILAGLVEHWGWLDETKNPDLEDIAASFAGGFFLVARKDGRLVATGGLLPNPEAATWQIVRMSVAADLRRAGMGRQILEALEHEARQRSVRRLILETTATWREVVDFYLCCGYRILPEFSPGIHSSVTQGSVRIPEDVYFEKWL